MMKFGFTFMFSVCWLSYGLVEKEPIAAALALVAIAIINTDK